MVRFPKRFTSRITIPYAVHTPEVFLSPVWPHPISLATTFGISFDFFSSPYLDVSVQAVPLIWLCIHHTMTGLQPVGSLHSDICGSTPACGSPQLFAAYHVLHRLPMPRHPPCALISLTYIVLLRCDPNHASHYVSLDQNCFLPLTIIVIDI